MLQYITDNHSTIPVEDQVAQVLEAGCGWIEIDTRGLSDDHIKEIVSKIMPKCLEKEAFLILRDKVELAKEINVGGVLLSLENEEFPSHARAYLGAAAVVGVEVNSKDKIASLKSLDIDYVVMTPFKASAYSNAQPLGEDGIRLLCDYMISEEMELPRVAAGGALATDVETLMKAGCNGVATSDLSVFQIPT
ncbi:MAG: thiamine phosphate synthase [Muribaculum sp.]|nr:thiamine phosphate synthase [Muribaculum sp.]